MRDRFLPISIIISSVIVCAGLLSLSQAITNRPFAGTPYIPSSFEITDRDYLSEWEAAAYTCMDVDYFIELLASGVLDGTYTSFESTKQIPDSYETVTGTWYVFSKAKLDDWMKDRIELRN